MIIIQNCSVSEIIQNPKKYNNILSETENGLALEIFGQSSLLKN